MADRDTTNSSAPEMLTFPVVPNNSQTPQHSSTTSAITPFSRITPVAKSTSSSRSPSASSSREPSPAGRVFRQQSIGASMSRKDRLDSPQRPINITSTIPSAAAIQRSLSTSTTPQLPPTSDPTSRIARPARITPTSSTSTTPGDTTPSWPISPRLKSPPPSGSRRNSLRTQKKPDGGNVSPVPPNIVIQNATPSSSTDVPSLLDHEIESDPRQAASSKPTSRGASGAPTLETVQETSGSNTPGFEEETTASANPDRKYFDMSEEDLRAPSGSSTPRRSMAAAVKVKPNNSDSDNGGKKEADADNDPDKTPRPKTVSTRTSFSSLKQKSGVEPTTRNMTVETETVNSVAQNTLGPPSDRAASGRTEHGGTLRAKASNDTIRPGKGRKKTSRKAPSINATSASTRADIFEDRVKNAMDEATSDDSDETFVYESNPPEPPVQRSRHHSRTPSANSLVSMVDARNNSRALQTALATQKTRSMKFANAHNSADDDVLDRQDGTIRASHVRNGGSSIHHHHTGTGRPSRNNTGHASILDDDSPFPQLNKVRSLTGMPGRQTQTQTPRAAVRNVQNGNGNTRKDNMYMSYDLDAEGGDDERTPLMPVMGTVRTPRSLRRPPTRGSRSERFPRRRQGVLTRFAGCIAMIAMLFLLVFGIVGFLFVITTPLTNVSILEIQNVLASEQEIMFDLVVGAVNPNLLPISIGEMDVFVFAKSKFVGSERWWREHPGGDKDTEPLPPRIPRDEGFEKPKLKRAEALVDAKQNFLPTPTIPWSDWDWENEPESGKTTMLLGEIDHFDNPLTFDPSFLKRHIHTSTGAIRLGKPGNTTELGGSARWERVLLHDFEFIVRGTLQYTIPLGGRSYNTSVGARILVQPGKDDEEAGPGHGVKTEAVDGTKQKWNVSVRALHEKEESFEERLKRRVWARVLRHLT